MKENIKRIENIIYEFKKAFPDYAEGYEIIGLKEIMAIEELLKDYKKLQNKNTGNHIPRID